MPSEETAWHEPDAPSPFAAPAPRAETATPADATAPLIAALAPAVPSRDRVKPAQTPDRPVAGRTVRVGVYRAPLQQAHKGEMWTETSDAWLQQAMPFPGVLFPPANSRRAGILMLRRCPGSTNGRPDSHWLLVWLTASADRMQPIYRIAVLPDQDPWPILGPTAERLLGATDGEIESLSEIRVEPEANSESARRALPLVLGVLDSMHKPVDGRSARPRTRVYATPQTPPAELAATLGIFARYITPEGSFVAITGPPPHAETQEFSAVKWDLLLSQPATAPGAADVDAEFEVVPTTLRSTALRGIPIDRLASLESSTFTGLFSGWRRPQSQRPGEWPLRLTVPLSMLRPGAMTDEEWHACCRKWEKTLDPAAMSEAASRLAEDKQEHRIIDLALIEQRVGRADLSRALLKRLGLDTGTFDHLLKMQGR